MVFAVKYLKMSAVRQAPPPMMLSPEGDDLSKGDFTSETKALALDLEMVSRFDCECKIIFVRSFFSLFHASTAHNSDAEERR